MISILWDKFHGYWNITRNKKCLEVDLGFKVILVENVFADSGYIGYNTKEMLQDLHEMLANSKKKAIFCSYG